MIINSIGLAETFSEFRSREKQLFPRPRNGESLTITPPAFAWLQVEDATLYRIQVFVKLANNFKGLRVFQS